MSIDVYDGQMIFGDLVGLKLPDNYLTGEEKPRKNLTQGRVPTGGGQLLVNITVRKWIKKTSRYQINK